MGTNGERVVSTRLGQMRIGPKRVVRFPRGLIGFERMRDFALLEIQPESPFLLLQSLEQPGLGFVVCNPYAFVTDYQVAIGNAEQKLLRAESISELLVLVTVSIPQGRPEQTSLNLAGPIVINVARRLGFQIPQVDQDKDTPSQYILAGR